LENFKIDLFQDYRHFAKYYRYRHNGMCLQVSCRIRNNLEMKVSLAWGRKHSSINYNWVCNQHRRLQVGRIRQHPSPTRYILPFNRENTNSFSDNELDSVSDIFAVDTETCVLPGGLS